MGDSAHPSACLPDRRAWRRQSCAMATNRRSRTRMHNREDLYLRADADVAEVVRKAAHARAIPLWAVVEAALTLGLPLLEPANQALPDYAYDTVHRRGRAISVLFVTIDPDLIAATRAAAAERHAHLWWVAQDGIARGLPLLPAPMRVPALDDEELPESA